MRVCQFRHIRKDLTPPSGTKDHSIWPPVRSLIQSTPLINSIGMPRSLTHNTPHYVHVPWEAAFAGYAINSTCVAISVITGV